METLKLQSQQQKRADLANFIDEYQNDLFWINQYDHEEMVVGNSYAAMCRTQTPFLAKFILRKIDNLMFENCKTDTYASIGRAIFHLYSGSGAETDYYTQPAWRIAVYNNPTLLNVLFNNSDSYEKTVGRKKILERIDAPIFTDTSEYCQHWNLLAEAAVFNSNAAVIRQIAIRFPAAIQPALSALADADKLIARYPEGIHSINLQNLREGRYRLLLALKSPEHDFYTVSYDDKRSIENYLLEKIQRLRSGQEVLDFYEHYNGAFVLNQHRLYAWACVKQFLFRRPEIPYPTIQYHVVEALQKKFFEFASTSMSLSEILNSRKTLFAESHFLKGVSIEWRDKMNEIVDLVVSEQNDALYLTHS